MDPKKAEWNEIISSKLKEGQTIEDLSFEYEPGIVMQPHVMKSDIVSHTNKVVLDNPWTNMAEIIAEGSTEKNRLALKALNEGANGLSFQVDATDSIQEVLKDILTEYLDVRMECYKLSPSEFTEKQNEVSKEQFPNVRWVHPDQEFGEYHIPASKRIEGIQKVLGQIGEGKRKVDIKVWLSKNLLFEISSLRALRSLLHDRVAGTFNIIATFDVEGTNELGDYNLIEKTYKILSGVIGGADAILTNYKGDEDSRLTLNIHNILDLESGLKNVMDPVGGAYYIEKLTAEIIRQVRNE